MMASIAIGAFKSWIWGCLSYYGMVE